MAVCGHKHGGATGNCCSANSPDKGVGDLCIADSDGVAFAGYALYVGTDIDIVTIVFEIGCARVLSRWGVPVARADAGKRPGTYRRVAVTTNVLEKRMITIGGVRAAVAVYGVRLIQWPC